MTWQSWSRTVRLLLPLDGCGGSFFDSGDAWGGSARDPISSTEQMPIPYALRRARLTARVSATRIRPVWVTYQRESRSRRSPEATEKCSSFESFFSCSKAVRFTLPHFDLASRRFDNDNSFSLFGTFAMARLLHV